jgi:hypothetical protein
VAEAVTGGAAVRAGEPFFAFDPGIKTISHSARTRISEKTKRRRGIILDICRNSLRVE